MTRLFLAAGEASGDLHGGLLARELRTLDPGIELVGIGGEAMAREGVRLFFRSEEMAVTGLWEVLGHLPRLSRILSEAVARLKAERPDAVVPIDFPDWNLRFAARAHRLGIPIVYYISPQVWAWRRGRLGLLARLVRRMIVIFPFEEDLYRQAGVPVTYVGHPLAERVRPRWPREETRRRLGLADGDRLIVLLPGSRPSEVGRILPAMLEARRRLAADGTLSWALALAPGLEGARAVERAREAGVIVRAGEAYELLAAADLALVASGTATLEAAILGAPMIVVYKMHPLTWQLARRIVKVPHVAMANLLAGDRVVPELLQGEANGERLAAEIRTWIDDPERRAAASARLRAVAGKLGEAGAPRRAAQAILAEIGR
ncbi:MAG: lipid-A-disaccharide synthase [Candidatus Eisenbacteria bacterium]